MSTTIDSIATYYDIKNTESNTYKSDNQKYQIDVIFDNLQGNSFALNLASLESLEIDQDSRNWYVNAALTIRNPKNAFEQKGTSTARLSDYYKFRNDGRDLVYIIIKPIIDSTIKESDLNLDYDIWGMAYTFAIYDREEIIGESADQKQLKLYLWEFDYQVLSETKSTWSTADMLTINAAYASDNEKLVYTGDAMQDLIKKTLKNFDTPVFSKYWDKGASKLFFTAPASYTANDALIYLYNKHVSSSTNDPAILNRTSYTRQWQLQSYSSIFNDATDQQGNVGRLHRETFTLTTQTGLLESEYTFNIKSPVLGYSSVYKFSNYQDTIRSVLRNVQITDMATFDSMKKMVTTPCYSNDIKNNNFQVDFKNTSIVNVKNFIQDHYSKKLSRFVPDTLISLNKTKTDGLVVNNIYSYGSDPISRLSESRNKILMAALLLNTSMKFEAPGSLIREAGTFITVASATGGVSDEFSSKTTGQWFVYKAIHRFANTGYTNDITAVRVHANDDIGIKNDIV